MSTRTRESVAAPGRASGASTMDLSVSGMSCASCAAHVEKALRDQPGVEQAAVNLATARAAVTYDPARTDLAALSDAVAQVGYTVAPASDERRGLDDEAAEARGWWRRGLVAWPLALAVLVLMLGYMDESWARWTAAVLTGAIVFGSGAPILRTAALEGPSPRSEHGHPHRCRRARRVHALGGAAVHRW